MYFRLMLFCVNIKIAEKMAIGSVYENEVGYWKRHTGWVGVVGA